MIPGMGELVGKDLSYKIIAVLFGVHKELGGGYQEKYYQRAVEGFRKKELNSIEQVMVPLSYQVLSLDVTF
jgi:GxxExxY protein